jgi:hypothetical protein
MKEERGKKVYGIGVSDSSEKVEDWVMYSACSSRRAFFR